MIDDQQTVSRGRRISMLAELHPDKPALIFVALDRAERIVTWQDLDKSSNQIARLFQQYGVKEDSTVLIGLSNSPEHYLVAIAAWKLGAMVIPFRWDMPKIEREELLALAQPNLVVADWSVDPYLTLSSVHLSQANALSDEPHPDVIPNPGLATTSGGSTGRPKLIAHHGPLESVPGASTKEPDIGYFLGFRSKQIQLVAGPLYHGAPFGWGHRGLIEDHTLIVTEKWDTVLIAELIERHRINFMFMVPTMMIRLAKLDHIDDYDFSSVTALFHAGGKCPAWVKRFWIERLGSQNIYEAFGSTEHVGFTAIPGDEWLEHPGSVGQPKYCDVKILDSGMNEVTTGEVGEIYFRLHLPLKPTYRYIGSPPAKATPDGFESMGDMGWVDESGYLYISDRRVDMIISGGANIFPAEVEAVLNQHHAVKDVVVIGLPNEEWGRTVHAIIVIDTYNKTSLANKLNIFCRQHLMTYKVPKSYEFLSSLPRDTMGKIRRKALMQERESDWSNDFIYIS